MVEAPKKGAIAETLTLAGGDRASRTLGIEVDPAIGSVVQQLLTLGVLPGPEEEEPGERGDRDHRALEHHHDPGPALVGERVDAAGQLGGLVVGIERRPRPHEHVGKHGPDQAHGDHVDDLGAVAEPLRLRQRADQREPDPEPREEEGRVLDPVQQRRVEGGRLVQRRDVPDVEDPRPEDERDHRVGQGADPAQPADREHRLQDRAGQPQDEQQRGDVDDQQVLDHVAGDQLLGELLEGRGDRDEQHDDPGREAGQTPGRHRSALRSQVRGADRVGDPDHCEARRREGLDLEHPARG
jgi:hypothetical protein